MFRLLLSLFLILPYLSGKAQQPFWENISCMPGITVNPIAIGKGYSAFTTYSLQLGVKGYPLKADFKFGFPSYNITKKYTNGYHFHNEGSYFAPGMIIYSIDLSERNAAFFAGLYGYFAHSNPTLTVKENDSWGSTAHYTSKVKTKGIILTFGGLFTIFRPLKASIYMDFGAVKQPNNLIPQIQNFDTFKAKHSFVPGIGHGIDHLLWGINIGLHYHIN